ncbi:DarT ssDNA thymidine ADP-ribosyltransferase family protein [Halomonas sp. GFAJ-1]|uniref:DarT ssDNA thymidine ADP-ribosyltransferase family protein n=1 Tax=Halomonas sp. GFAJ-1 TaxID=1118153 RepID=UPI00023A33C9|nr:DarT ssDNA thymidine ADP-ribosyltransferase family protein [Halomonas sp. GFAJ-1]AVI62978.1 hypothetical protein BB497_09880 [Halomonas sp. GFAJ-1]EHK60285.1 hypothetical protein MOY_11317 [Halomonas sp. GFAJ-1]
MQKGHKVVHVARPELGVGEIESVVGERFNVRFGSSGFSGIPTSALAPAALAATSKTDAPLALTPEAHLQSVSQRYGIGSLWHITSRENVATILGRGLMSRHLMQQSGLAMVDISDATVQDYRVAKGIRNGLSLHDYVPLYLRAQNPMLFCRRAYNRTLCLLEIDISAWLQQGVLFTDGNAASLNTCFYERLSDLRFLDWDALNATYWTNVPDGKRKRCAEVLVPNRLPARFILRVHTASLESAAWLAQQGVQATFSPHRFF